MSVFQNGVAAGIVFALVLFMGIYINKKMKKESMMEEFDERQLMARSNAYSTAFFVMMLLICLDGFLKLCGICWYEEPLGEFTILFITLIIFAWKAITSDAFFGNGDESRKKTMLIMYLVIGISQLVIGLTNLDEMVVDGKLSFRVISMFCGIVFLSISIMMWIHERKLNMEEDED